MVIKVEVVLNACVDAVWDAITNPDEMKQWYFDNIPAFKAEVGFTTQFMVESGGKSFTHIWEVTKVLPKKEIKYNWSYEEYQGLGFVSFKLASQGERTFLSLTNGGLETFPQDIPEFTRESCVAGWEFFIKKNLPKYLENKAQFDINE